MPVSLVLADDHPIVLDGLERLFSAQEDFAVVARCRDGAETLRAVRQHRPDVLVLDVRMPEPDGLAVLRELQGEGLATRIVLLTAELDEDEVLEAVRVTGEDCFVVRCAFGQPADLERVVDALAAFGSVSTALVLSHPVNKAVPLG